MSTFKYLTFDGVDDRVSLGTALLTPFTKTVPFTIEARVKTSTLAAMAVVCSQMTGASGKGIQFGFNADGTIFLRVQGDFRLNKNSNVSQADGVWNNIAASFDGGILGAGIQLYKEGVLLAGTVSAEADPADMTDTNPTYIGARNATEVPFNGSVGGLRVWRGVRVQAGQLAAQANSSIANPLYTLFDTHVSKFAAQATQGVATDGTYIYASRDATIDKFNMAGVLQSSYSHGISGFKNEDMYVLSGVLYVALTNHATTPRAGKVQKITASSMALVSTTNLVEAIWPAGISYKGGYWWISVTESSLIYQYDSNFSLVATFNFPVFGTQQVIYPGYSGIEWIGNYLYGNKHEDDARGLDVAYWNGSGFEAVGAFYHVTLGSTQGLAYDATNSKMYWAARGHSGAVYQSNLTGGLIAGYTLAEGSGLSLDDWVGANDGSISGATWVDETPAAPSSWNSMSGMTGQSGGGQIGVL